ncbi:MAG: type III pantothenate kinase [Bdellovibrionaceae bacterium]|nr:type III pantothenate kinase [Pseudobdellovibrionaceae bacterium]
MILALDVGNTQMYGGVFDGENIRLRFRMTSQGGSSADEYGVFLRNVLRENDFDFKQITQIGICTVVPDVMYSLRRACEKYFKLTPFNLQPGVKTGLRVKYHNPVEVGADRIANSIAAMKMYPKRNLVIVDLGTATTFCAISADKDYLGGSIIAGMRLNMEALEAKTAKLPLVEIVTPARVLGQTTVESIQSGLYYGHLGQMKEITQRLTVECFNNEKPFVIGTGGFSTLFEREKVFDAIQPDLVLKGLSIAMQMNLTNSSEGAAK